MIDQTNINLLSLIPTELKKVASTGGGEYAGACPMCGGTDRFRVQPNNVRWFCRQCSPQGGDAIAFLMAYENIEFKEAIQKLGVGGDYTPQPQEAKRPQPTLHYQKSTGARGCDIELWQERVHKFIDYSESMLWGDDTTGLDYMLGRGFAPITLEHYRIGYNPRDIGDNWGLEKNVYLPRGIVIPYAWGEYAHISKLRIRRIDYKPTDTTSKYIPPKGVSNVPFLTRRLRPGDIVVLMEGEIDAMILKQSIPNPNVVALATGGTGGARLISVLAQLALCKIVLVAFDSDKAGNNASSYWLDALPNARQLAPVGGDINDMWLNDVDMYSWLDKGLGQ